MSEPPDRPPLDEASLARQLAGPGRPWQEVRVVPRTGSTNADLAARAVAGAPGGLVLVAEEQLAGRGRLDRTWTSPARAGLTFSVLWRPVAAPVARWGWLSQLTGLALAEAVERATGLPARLKWPNDLVVEDRKLAGVLAELVAGAVVVGVGLNVSTTRAELPVPGATSLLLEGVGAAPRQPLLGALLDRLAERYAAWEAGAGDPESGLRSDLVERSAVVGRVVRVSLPGDRTLEGLATGLDREGRLVLDTPAGPVPVAAGDVVRVR